MKFIHYISAIIIIIITNAIRTMWLNTRKYEVKLALELAVLMRNYAHDELIITQLLDNIAEPMRSMIQKEMKYMSLLTLEELYTELDSIAE